MARPKRILYNGAIYHVMARANGHRRLFVDDVDRLFLFQLLGEARVRYSVRWLVVTLMTSHYHAEVQTPAGDLPEAMRYVHSRFARHWNRRHRTRGHVFGDRFVSKPIEDDRSAWTALKYIVCNPFEGGYVKHPDEWVW